MSEGPEVKRTADKLSLVLVGQTIEKIICRNVESQKIVESLSKTSIEQIQTHGKNIIIQFSNGIFLRNHMMMWGKWRIYDRKRYDEGRAKAPARRVKKYTSFRMINSRNTTHPSLLALTKAEEEEEEGYLRTDTNADSPLNSSASEESDEKNSTSDDVRSDRRVRLVIFTKDSVAVQFNGPILKFTKSNPLLTEQALMRLGPDPLKPDFSYDEARIRYDARLRMKIADLLLDQTFVAGIGNKYKSELLFMCKLYPFITASRVSADRRDCLINKIPDVLKFGYENSASKKYLTMG
jgi:endonuclease VIII